MMQHIILINPHSTRLQLATNFDRAIEIRRVDGGSETVGGGVAQTDGVLLGLEFGNGADGAENFFLHDLHVFAYAGEDCGLDEVAFFAVALAADLDFGAFFFTVVDVALRMWVSMVFFRTRQLRGWV